MKNKLKGMIYIPSRCRCPYCGYEKEGLFPIEHYEGGSAGYRTFRCPVCGKEIEE